MEHGLVRNWWVLALRGVLAIAFGVLVFLWPGLAWVVIVGMFAAYALLDGILAIVAAVTGHAHGGRLWGLILEGVVGIAAGVLTLAWPGVTGMILLYFIGFWAIFTGVFEIAAAIRLRKDITGEWALALAGIVSVGFGLAILFVPAAGAVAIAWLIGAYAVTFGVVMLALAFRLRSWSRGRSAAMPAA
jgi:uncharacterized membrane protein HdeD (DUF308 family)